MRAQASRTIAVERQTAPPTREEFAALAIKVEALTARVEQLEAGRIRRSPPDIALRRQLAVSTSGLAFIAADLLRRAGVDKALSAALDAALIDRTPDGVGAWMRASKGTHSGVTVTRLSGRRWTCTWST